jgi:hypothetical protein
MPEVVLRNAQLPNQPIVLTVPVGEKISREYKAAGWEIDSETSPEDARAQSAAYSAEAAQRAVDAEDGFVAAFEDDGGEPSASEPLGESTSGQPTGQPGDTTTSEQGDPLDLTKES